MRQIEVLRESEINKNKIPLKWRDLTFTFFANLSLSKNKIPPKWQDGTFLIQYQGGGYDGCLWEWNFALIMDNELINLQSTGHRGIKDIEGLLEITNEKEGDKFFVYNLKKEKSIREFTTETSEGLVIAIGEKLYDMGIKINCKCDLCKKEKSIHRFESTGYRGAGGIEIAMTGLVCEDCYSSHLCDNCNEYTPDLMHSKDFDQDLCEDCFKELSKK